MHVELARGTAIGAGLLLSACAAHPAQEPVGPVGYVRTHRAADEALQRGELDLARAMFLDCLERSPDNPTVAYGLACVENRDGRTSTALAWLENAAAWGYADAELAAWDADLAALRGDERFEALLDVMRERPAARAAPQPVWLIDAPVGHRPQACAIDPAGRTVVVAYDDGAVTLFDTETGRPLERMRGLPGRAWRAAYSPDGSCFAALAHDGTVGVWSVDDDEPIFLAEGMRAPKSAIEKFRDEFGEGADPHPSLLQGLENKWPFGAFLEFDPSGERLLVAGTDLGGSLWTRDGECVHRWEAPLGHFFSVPLAWSPGGSLIAWADGNTVHLFDAQNGDAIATSIASASPVRCLDFNPNGTSIATGHGDGFVRSWGISDGRLLWEEKVSLEMIFADPFHIGSIAHSPDGRRLALTTAPGVRATVLDLESGDQTWTSGFWGGRMGEPVPVRWSPAGDRLWFAFASGVMALGTVEPGEGVAEVKLADGFVPTLAATREEGDVLAATILGSVAVAVLEGDNGRVRWIRTELEGARTLVQAHTGHFTTDSDSFEDWTVSMGYRDVRRFLERHVELLFDPKRVRASRAGIPLVPVERP